MTHARHSLLSEARATTRLGGLMVAALLGYGLAAQAQSGWLYIALGLVCGAIPVGVVYPLLAVRGMRATAQMASGRHMIREGEILVLDIEIANPTILPRYWLVVTDCSGLTGSQGGGATQFIATVPRKGAITLRWTAMCERRGVFHVPVLRVSTAAPFGLLRAMAEVEVAEQELVVHPRWWTLPGPGTTASASGGGATARRRQMPGGEFAGTRPYRAGDSLRWVHWRSTARHDTLIVRETDNPTPVALTILLDAAAGTSSRTPRGAGSGVGMRLSPALQPADESAQSTFDVAVRLAASAARWALSQEYAVSMYSNSLTPRAPGSVISWARLLDYLARVEPAMGAAAIAGMLDTIAPTSLVLVILPRGIATEGTLAAIAPPLLALRRRGATVTVAIGGPHGSDHQRVDGHMGSFREALTGAGVRVVTFAGDDLEVIASLC